MADERGHLEEAAACLAGEFDLETDQVLTALRRIDGLPEYFMHPPVDELRLALSASDPGTVLAEFLREDIAVISVRVAWLDYMSSSFTPLYTRRAGAASPGAATTSGAEPGALAEDWSSQEQLRRFSMAGLAYCQALLCQPPRGARSPPTRVRTPRLATSAASRKYRYTFFQV